MSREARGPFPFSDAKTAPARTEESWRALFATDPPHAAAWIEQAISWQEQVLQHGDVTAAIRRDLRMAAAPSRTGSDAITSGTSTAGTGETGLPSRNGAAVLGDAENVSPRTLSAQRGSKVGSSRAILPSAPTSLPPASSQLLPGSKLVKVHAGGTHVVEVIADGMLYKGERYASLSAVAKAITGTHWNGLLFFGLRKRGTYPKKARANA